MPTAALRGVISTAGCSEPCRTYAHGACDFVSYIPAQKELEEHGAKPNKSESEEFL